MIDFFLFKKNDNGEQFFNKIYNVDLGILVMGVGDGEGEGESSGARINIDD